MKTLRILATAISAWATLAVGADGISAPEANAVGVYLSDGSRYKIALSSRPSLKIEGSLVTISANDADFAILDYFRIHKLTFETAETTLVSYLPSPGTIRIDNRRLILSGFAAGTPLAISDLRGTLRHTAVLTPDETEIPLQPGLYIITAGHNTLKALVK